MKTDFKAMPPSLPEEKTQKIKLKCLELYVSILELTQVLDHLTSTIQAVLPQG